MASSEEKLDALLHDLQELTTYLHGRGEKTLALSKASRPPAPWRAAAAGLAAPRAAPSPGRG